MDFEGFRGFIALTFFDFRIVDDVGFQKQVSRDCAVCLTFSLHANVMD